MRKVILSFFLIAAMWHADLQAQQILPQVISSAGNYFTGTSLQVDQTIGEMAQVSTLSSPQLIITQGFLQPQPLWLTSAQQTVVQDISLFPNPASGLINIQFKNFMKGKVLLTLYNAIGQLMRSEQVSISGNENYVLDLNDFSNGIYYLRVFQANQIATINKSLKVQIIQ